MCSTHLFSTEFLLRCLAKWILMSNVHLQKAGIHKFGPSPCHAVSCLRSAHLSNAGHTFIFRPANISGAMSNVRIHNLGPWPYSCRVRQTFVASSRTPCCSEQHSFHVPWLSRSLKTLRGSSVIDLSPWYMSLELGIDLRSDMKDDGFPP
jgi:hypothetical protein